MPKCKSCGAELAEGAKFCGECGTSTGSVVTENLSQNADVQKSVCPQCRTQIQGEHKYCPSCGTNLKETAKQDSATTPNPTQPIQPNYQSEHNAQTTGAQNFPQDDEEDDDNYKNYETKNRPTVAKRIIGILVIIGDILGCLGLSREFGWGFSGMFVCILLVTIIVLALNLVPTVLYIFFSNKNLSFGKAYEKSAGYFSSAILLIFSVLGYIDFIEEYMM